jgi:aromatic ring-cleaving dioxygenase
MKRYHAHIYFEDHEIVQIKQLKKDAETSPLNVWNLFEHCVGPHSRPMLELHFTSQNETLAIHWLEQNRGHFSVLLHEDTGDDVTDHERARWLGEPLVLHFQFFEEVKANPKLAIHPNS